MAYFKRPMIGANLCAVRRISGGPPIGCWDTPSARELAKPGGSIIVAHMTSGSTLVKHSVRIAGHSTSVSLEQAFWIALREIAAQRQQSVSALIGAIDAARDSNLSSAIRVFVLESCRCGILPAAGKSGADAVAPAPVLAHLAENLKAADFRTG
ncbi:MAG TPA: ribbon-helix-helix domain-containing protein [Stellaceae bacterium]|nr:ribbon-helix-helix domain-containing protein [Stellaceae bacterium]